jgi:hypothetical protein
MTAMHATKPDKNDQFLAWNGLRASVPGNWSPSGLGLRHVCLADDEGPAFEWKWRPGAGREGMEAALRALTPQRRARAGGDLPRAWLDALADYELMPMTWARDGRSGLGAALFHPDTGTAAVFQAYGGPDGPDAARLDAVAAVLASLSLDQAGPPAFSLYGLTLTAPAGYVLATFSFDPGRFVLGFAAPRRRLDVVRLAPASVLLARQSAEDWTRQALGFSRHVPVVPDGTAASPLWWAGLGQGRRLGERLARWCGRRGRLGLLRHDTTVDKFLGAAATAGPPVDRDWLAGVVAGCVSL